MAPFVAGRLRCWKVSAWVAAVLALFVGPGAAEAARITTPPLIAEGANSINCRVANTSDNFVADVTIELIDSLGVVRESSTLDVNAGGTRSTSTSSNPGIRWCRVTGIGKGVARVTLCVIDSADTCIAAVSSP